MEKEVRIIVLEWWRRVSMNRELVRGHKIEVCILTEEVNTSLWHRPCLTAGDNFTMHF